MRRHDERLARMEEALTSITRSIDRIEVATIVREPSVGPAADAYEGLRRQVLASVSARTSHLAQLAALAEVVRRGDTDALPGLLEGWMRDAGLERREDPTDDSLFDVLGPDGPRRTVRRPAYVDGGTGRPVMMGQAEAEATPVAASEAEVPTAGAV